MKDKFQQLAAYNRWANARLYAAALDLHGQTHFELFEWLYSRFFRRPK